MRVVSNFQQISNSRASAQYDVVVVGAGPYGLSTAAHLMGKGLRVAVFGKPLELWREHMPKGMLLRSHWWATNLSDPDKAYGFTQFFQQSEYDKCYPVPIEAFIEYGMWFQKRAVPQVDTTYISSIERIDEQFLLTVEDGRTILAPAVVMAIGLYYYANRPAEYQHLPADLVTHSFEHDDFRRFAGKQVVVIGAGQSAIEYSALLYEAGASAHLVARRPVRWLDPDTDAQRRFIDQLRAPRNGIAPGWKNWGLEYFPYLFSRLPQARKDHYVRKLYLSAASDWLRDRVIGKVVLHEGCVVENLQEVDGGLIAALSSGETLQVDHLILATGYKVDIGRLPMLSAPLLSEIRTHVGSPILTSHFESSVAGLYFVGLSSLSSFGPLYRFVVGTKATAPRVASAVASRLVRGIRAQ